MPFKGTAPVRSKVVINYNILEQIKTLLITWLALFHARMKKTLVLKYQNFSR